MKVTRVRARYRTPPALRPVDLSMWRNVALSRSCPPCSGALAPSSCPVTLRASPVACVVTCGYCLSDVDSFHDAVDLGVDRSSVTPTALLAVSGGACTGLHSSNASRKHVPGAQTGFRYRKSTCGRPVSIP